MVRSVSSASLLTSAEVYRRDEVQVVIHRPCGVLLRWRRELVSGREPVAQGESGSRKDPAGGGVLPVPGRLLLTGPLKGLLSARKEAVRVRMKNI